MKPLQLNLDIKNNSYEEMTLMQGYTYPLEATLTDGGQAFNLTGHTVTIELLKADNTFIIQSETITIKDNVVSVAMLKDDFTRVRGTGKLQIVARKGELITGSWVVSVRIKEGAIIKAVGESKDTVTIKETLDKSIQKAIEENAKTEHLIQTGGAATKGDIAEVNSQLDSKASKSEVSNALSFKRDISSKIPLSDFADDAVKAITGDTTLTVLSTPVDLSVTPDKTNFLKANRINKFDKNNIINGILSKAGNITANTSYIHSNFIDVLPNSIVYITTSWDCCFYDINKVYISGVTGNGSAKSVPTPINAYFIKVTFEKINLDVAMVSNNPITDYKPYSEYDSISVSDLRFKKLLDDNFDENNKTKKVDYGDTTFLKKNYKNKFDKKIAVSGILSSSTGLVVPNANYVVSDFMAVKELTNYYTTDSWDGCFYDINKNRIIGVTNTNIPKLISTPKNAVYFRITYDKAKIDTSMFYEGSTLLPYFEYESEYTVEYADSKLEDLIKDNNLKGLRWGVVGDSITESNATALKKYHDFIKEETGINVFNYGKSGTGWFMPQTPTSNNAIWQRLDNMDSDLDLITVFAGVNDWGSKAKAFVMGTLGDKTTDTFYGSVDYIITKLIDKYPTKTIAVFTPLREFTEKTTPAPNGVTLEQISNAIIEVCGKYSIPVLNLYKEANCFIWNDTYKATYQPDGTHPNIEGHKRFKPRIKNFLNLLF